VFSQTALDAGFGPAGLLLVRFSVAAVLVGIIYRKTIRRSFSLAAFRRVFILGVILAASFLAQTLGLMFSTPSNNALITAAYVVITPFLWRLVFKKKPTRSAYAASVICFFGVVALSFDFSAGFSFRAGDLWTLGCAVLFAAQIVATEAYVGDGKAGVPAQGESRLDYGLLLFIELFTAALTTALLVLAARVAVAAFPGIYDTAAPLLVTRRDLDALLSPSGAVSAAFLGVLSTALCYVMQTSAQRYVSSGAASIILSMESMFGAVFSVLTGYDALSFRLVLGGGLILASVTLQEIVNFTLASRSGSAVRGAEQHSRRRGYKFAAALKINKTEEL
jgi:drug/metabolite transporter (DMT)-like permease